MLDTIYKETRERMENGVDAVEREFITVRTGKATIGLLDTVKVDTYGSQMPINQVATLSAPEPRLLVVQAFDKNTVPDIVKGIQKADLGLNPIVDGQIIRLPIPPLNEERRKEMVRRCKNIAEDGRVSIRNARRDANDQIKNAQKDKDISEDDEKKALAKVQEMTNEFTEKIDKLIEVKEKDLMEV